MRLLKDPNTRNEGPVVKTPSFSMYQFEMYFKEDELTMNIRNLTSTISWHVYDGVHGYSK